VNKLKLNIKEKPCTCVIKHAYGRTTVWSGYYSFFGGEKEEFSYKKMKQKGLSAVKEAMFQTYCIVTILTLTKTNFVFTLSWGEIQHAKAEARHKYESRREQIKYKIPI